MMIDNTKIREHYNRITQEKGAYRYNYAYKEEKLYVIFAGDMSITGKTDLFIVTKPDELTIACLQLILSYGSPMVRPMERKQQLLKIMSLDQEMTITKLSRLVHMEWTYVAAMLSLEASLNLGTMPVASAYALSKFGTKMPEALIGQAQRMSSSEFVPLCWLKYKEHRAAQREAGRKKT